MLTAFLARADVSRHAQALHLLQELREALGSEVELRPPPTALSPSTRVELVSLGKVPATAVITTLRTGPPRTLLQLHDAKSGKLLAVMDATQLQVLRASLVAALSADVLARQDARSVAVLGSGPAVSGVLKALRLVRSLDRATLWGPDLAATTELAFRLQNTLAASVRAQETRAAAVADADIIVALGELSLVPEPPAPGVHVTVLGAEASTAPPTRLLERTACFADGRLPEDWGLAPTLLGQVLRGEAAGRTSPGDSTVFFSVAPPFLDLVAAWHVFQGARQDEGLTRIELEA